MFTINLKFWRLFIAAVKVFFTKAAEMFLIIIGCLSLFVVCVGRPIFGLKFTMLLIVSVKVFFAKAAELIEMTIGAVALLIIFSIGRPIFWLIDQQKKSFQGVNLVCGRR